MRRRLHRQARRCRRRRSPRPTSSAASSASVDPAGVAACLLDDVVGLGVELLTGAGVGFFAGVGFLVIVSLGFFIVAASASSSSTAPGCSSSKDLLERRPCPVASLGIVKAGHEIRLGEAPEGDQAVDRSGLHGVVGVPADHFDEPQRRLAGRQLVDRLGGTFGGRPVRVVHIAEDRREEQFHDGGPARRQRHLSLVHQGVGLDGQRKAEEREERLARRRLAELGQELRDGLAGVVLVVARARLRVSVGELAREADRAASSSLR